MIDIHTHMLPNIDDGPTDIKETIEMLYQSVKHNVREVVFTPHAHCAGMNGIEHREKIITTFKKVKEYVKLENLDIKLHLGMEVFSAVGLNNALENRELLSLNQSRYLLVEFPFLADEEYFSEYLTLLKHYPIKPIIAHPERYEAVQDMPLLAHQWNVEGYILQINSGSLLGDFGPSVMKTAKILLDHNLAQVVASDSHNLTSRAPNLLVAYNYICQQYSKGYGDLLFKVNPQFILENQEVLIINPQKPEFNLFF